jgi:hypothetical protein
LGWVPAAINTPLREGDRIWVPQGGRTEVQLSGGIYIRLDSSTSFDILTLQEESFQFYLTSGHAYINNRKGGIDHIQVDTPLSSVGSYDNTLLMLDVAESGATDISVLKGYSFAEVRSGKTRIGTGHSLHIGEDAQAELSALPAPDEWERWNRNLDRRLAEAGESLRYVPDELDDYAYDLDANGRWLYQPDYGYVWVPRVAVGVDWAPYRVGRWTWVGDDYVWVSYEPWGWAPYHYGRWAFASGFGWCWVPPARGAVYWGPGWVGWVHTPTYVAWVPLAPGDVYARPLVVGVNVAIGKGVVFKNINVRGGVTVVGHNSFIAGKQAVVRLKDNPFLARDARAGLPAARPERLAASPVVKAIPVASRAPERITRVSVGELRQQRRLVPQEKASVFRPERPAAQLPVRERGEPGKIVRPPQPKEEPPPGVRRNEVRGIKQIRQRPEGHTHPQRQEPGKVVRKSQPKEEPRPEVHRNEVRSVKQIRQQPDGQNHPQQQEPGKAKRDKEEHD